MKLYKDSKDKNSLLNMESENGVEGSRSQWSALEGYGIPCGS
jgi:hypothetical protein